MNNESIYIDKGFRETEVYSEIKEVEKEIIQDLEGLKAGQSDLDEKMDAGFEKGRVRMNTIENKMDNQDKKRDDQHLEMMRKIDAKEMSELKAEIRKRNESDEKTESRKWDATKIFLSVVATALVTYAVISFKG